MYSSNNYGMDELDGIAFDKDFDRDLDILLNQLSNDDELVDNTVSIDLNEIYLTSGILLYNEEPIEDVDTLLDDAIDFCLLNDEKSLHALKDIYIKIGL